MLWIQDSWYPGTVSTVHMAQQCYCPCGSVVFLSTWLSGSSVHVVQWSFHPRGSLALLFTWLSGPSVHVTWWSICPHGSVVLLFTWLSGIPPDINHTPVWILRFFFLVLWKTLLGFCRGIALLKLQAPFDKMSISHYRFFQQVSASYIKGCVELCQTFSCFMKMILWFLSLIYFCAVLHFIICVHIRSLLYSWN